MYEWMHEWELRVRSISKITLFLIRGIIMTVAFCSVQAEQWSNIILYLSFVLFFKRFPTNEMKLSKNFFHSSRLLIRGLLVSSVITLRNGGNGNPSQFHGIQSEFGWKERLVTQYESCIGKFFDLDLWVNMVILGRYHDLLLEIAFYESTALNMRIWRIRKFHAKIIESINLSFFSIIPLSHCQS